MDGGDVGRVGRIDEDSDRDEHIAGPDLVAGQAMFAGFVDRRGVVVLVGDHQRHEAIAGIGQGQRHGASIEIEHPDRPEHIRVVADDLLVVGVRRLAMVMQHAHLATGEPAEVHVGLRPGEGVGGDRDLVTHGYSWRGRARSV
jgi:hypothetical protein